MLKLHSKFDVLHFILTMWDVNEVEDYIEAIIEDYFILTMWDVNFLIAISLTIDI